MNNNSLNGTYNLVAWENRHESGKITYPLGPDAQGIITYSPDGYVFVHITVTLSWRFAAVSVGGAVQLSRWAHLPERLR